MSRYSQQNGPSLIIPTASRSSSPPTSRTVLAPRTLRRSTLTPTPRSAKTLPSSPPRRPRTGSRRAKSTGLPSSRSSSARPASRRRSRPSRPSTPTSRRLLLLSGCFLSHVSLYAPTYAYAPKTRLCSSCHHIHLHTIIIVCIKVIGLTYEQWHRLSS